MQRHVFPSSQSLEQQILMELGMEKKIKANLEDKRKDEVFISLEKSLGSDSDVSIVKETQGKVERDLEFIMDIPVKITVELGRRRMMINELLNLGEGSVVELNKLAGEPMEVLVNDKLIARGEAVVVNDKFGVRLLDVVSPNKRIEPLKS